MTRLSPSLALVVLLNTPAVAAQTATPAPEVSSASDASPSKDPVALAEVDASGEIDASKPTNFYTLLDNQLEATVREQRGNNYGYRANLLLAPSEAHLIMAEIPILYNDLSKKVGPGDVRLRYFFLPYKNYDNFFGAAGPSVDVFAPTGSYDDGHGSGRWVVSPGVTVGLMFADWIQAFPILSYQYLSKVDSDQEAVVEGSTDLHGLTAQVLIPIVFSDKAFMQVTPVYAMSDLGDAKSSSYSQELFGGYMFMDGAQVTAFYRGAFAAKVHSFRLGLTLFL